MFSLTRALLSLSPLALFFRSLCYALSLRLSPALISVINGYIETHVMSTLLLVRLASAGASRRPSRRRGSSFGDIFGKKQWSGVAFAAKMARQQNDAAKEAEQLEEAHERHSSRQTSQQQQQEQQPLLQQQSHGEKEHFYRSFNPRKLFQVTVRDRELDLFNTSRKTTLDANGNDSDERRLKENGKESKITQESRWLSYLGF